MKKVKDYDVGEAVYDHDYNAGRVVCIATHPDNKTIGYVLVATRDEAYTFYRGQMDCNAALSLARHVPESVAMQFSEVILGRREPSVPERERKYPFVAPKPQDSPSMPTPADQETKAPFFDFL